MIVDGTKIQRKLTLLEESHPNLTDSVRQQVAIKETLLDELNRQDIKYRGDRLDRLEDLMHAVITYMKLNIEK